jgi:phosphoinositide-3-kinase regulatory subunit 4
LTAERDRLRGLPNILPYDLVVETERAAYAIRYFVHGNMYDRLSTRPFLAPIEKKWIAFQLLTAVKESHARKIYHGDIKTENVLITSWNWVLLSDFSSFKPVYLPDVICY